MQWKEVTKMQKKRSFVYRALEGVESFTELCREFGISTKAGYKWKARFLERGLAGLAELSRKPGGNPNHTDEKTICKIIRIKNNRPRWGAKKIYAVFCRLSPEHKDDVSVPTIDRLLARSGLTKPRGKKRRKTGERLVLREKPSTQDR
jgi:transposase-like protein